MKAFEYVAIGSAPEALQSGGSKVSFIAGGTTLLDLMKLGVETPATLVDINSLPWNDVHETDSGLRIGALVRNSDLAYDPLVKERYPLLSEALLSGASPQLRNMATVGGNLLQRTRCTYFRDLHWACNKRDPGAGCSAKDGHHRMHAIFGVSEHCFATQPSDMAVAMTALEAAIEMESPAGKRQVPIHDFFRLPGDTPHIETAIQQGELISAVILPRPDPKWKGRYRKVRDRASYEFALVSVAALLGIDDGKIRNPRIVLGGVGTVPWRSKAAEAALDGAKATEDTFLQAAAQALDGAQPARDNQFKVELLKRTIVTTLREISGEQA